MRLRSLDHNGMYNMFAADVAAFTAEVAAHPSLRALSMSRVTLRADVAALDAVVDAALTLRLARPELYDCGLRPAFAGALHLLLSGDALRELTLWRSGPPLATPAPSGPTAVPFSAAAAALDAHAVTLLADALQSNRTLTTLCISAPGLWRDVDAAALLLQALVGHASLTRIDLRHNAVGHAAAAAIGALLGELVAADSSLRVLNVSFNRLGAAGLGPLLDALPQNTHLRELHIEDTDALDAAFVSGRLMPALVANTSLQTLCSGIFAADTFIAARHCRKL